MAVVKIISGDLPRQNAGMVGQTLVVQLSNKGQRSYSMNNAIVTIDTVSERKKKVVFDIELRDGVKFRGETEPDTFHNLKKYEGAKSGNYILSEKSAKEVAKTNKRTAIVISILAVLFVWWMVGDDEDRQSNTPQKIITFERAGNFGCIDRAVYELLVNAAVENGQRFFTRALQESIDADVCVMFKQGEQFTVMKEGGLMMRLRRDRDGEEFWTGSD